MDDLEKRLARLEHDTCPPPANGSSGEAFWALDGLKALVDEPGGILFTGSVTLPGGEHYEWQEGRAVDALLEDDHSQSVATLSALAHPVRLLVLREILHGAHTVTELAEHEQIGTSGQIYHHLRQLISAGWLRSTARGRYAVPGERVVALLVLLAIARR